jgi:hypothetical protein
MDLVTRTRKAFWSNLDRIILLGAWAAAAILFAWAVDASALLAGYRPLSTVFALFLGAALAAGIWQLGATAQRQMVRNAYDSRLLARSGAIDPLARTFENKRIYLNDFVLPSKPLIEDKTFIDCEIIGPANIVLLSGNAIGELRPPHCDAVLIAARGEPSNGYAFRNCTFRGCSFLRVTLMVTEAELEVVQGLQQMRWLNPPSDGQGELLLYPSFSIGLVQAQEAS